MWIDRHPQCRFRTNAFGKYMSKKNAGHLNKWDDPSNDAEFAAYVDYFFAAAAK